MDREDSGNVDALKGEKVIITSRDDRNEYSLSIDPIEWYNGAEVF